MNDERRIETTVDLTPGFEDVATASLRTRITGNQRWMAKAMAEMADQLAKMAEALGALELDVKTSRAERYRAGREDAAREALINYADRHHRLGDSHGPVSMPSGWIDADAWCACGASWIEDEGGCSERAQLLADADQPRSGTHRSGGDHG